MWLNELKIALIEKNIDKINSLMDNLPQLEEKQDVTTAIYLIKEATTLVTGLRDETKASMVQMKKNIDFLNSATANKTSRFDITS